MTGISSSPTTSRKTGGPGEELPLLTDYAIPKCYYSTSKKHLSTQLHGFCDASQLAYAGVVYLRTVYTDTSTTISLVTSKTKVSPLNTLTIPRLELCGAQLLSKLLLSTMDALAIPIQDVHAWCDSTITLGWLNTSPQKLKTVISNRVTNTVKRVRCAHWHYVKTDNNPADIASRGQTPKELILNEQWWSRPHWLSLSPDEWPIRADLYCHKGLPEFKAHVHLVRPVKEDFSVLFSSYPRVVAWCLRFIRNVKRSADEKKTIDSNFQLGEIEAAERRLLSLSKQ